MKWKVRVHLATAASFLEIFLACLLALALGICAVRMIPSLRDLALLEEPVHSFHEYLETLFVLVIGTEALKMLCKHTPGSALEVLLFTIAREMVVKETSPVENLIVVLSIAVIFAIRKFLFVPAFGSEGTESSFEHTRRSLRGWREAKQEPAAGSAPAAAAAAGLAGAAAQPVPAAPVAAVPMPAADDEVTAELDTAAVAAGLAAKAE